MASWHNMAILHNACRQRYMHLLQNQVFWIGSDITQTQFEEINKSLHPITINIIYPRLFLIDLQLTLTSNNFIKTSNHIINKYTFLPFWYEFNIFRKKQEKQIHREENRKTRARHTQRRAQDNFASTTHFPK